MKIGETLSSYRNLFESAGFDSPELESAYILSEVTGIPHTTLIIHKNTALSAEQEKLAHSFLERRLRHEPWQYIFGWAAFRQLELKVGPGVLVPRPETELLVELVMRSLKPGSCVCELGVGSGAISLALASERPDLWLYGSEYSEDALKWANRNLQTLSLGNVSFHQGNLFSPFAGMQFDAVVANLPYISEEERPFLPQNVRDFEPEEALFASENGFSVITRAIREAPEYLKKEHSFLFFEIGESQGEKALNVAADTVFFHDIKIEKDQYNVPRFLVCSR